MHKKVLALVFSVLSLSLVFASSAKALTMGSLEPEYASGSKIEFNTPADGNTFDVTFLAKNQNLTYKTTITNDNENASKITNIELKTPEYDFLEYTFNGLAIGDELAPNATRELTINISSNSNDTHTVEDDFKLSIHFHTLTTEPTPTPTPAPTPTPEPKPEAELPVPDTGAQTIGISSNAKNNYAIIYTVSIIAFSILALFILIKNKRIKNSYAIISILSFAATFLTLTGIVNAEKDEVLTITGKVRFTNVYTITINPGDGLYEGVPGTQTMEIHDGERVEISQPTYDTYRFTGWTIEPPATLTPTQNNSDTLIVDKDYNLTANWEEIYYNLTINPNGGIYNENTETQTTSVRAGVPTTILTASKTGTNFQNWTKETEDPETNEKTTEAFNDTTLTLSGNTTLTANYEDIYFDVTVDPNGGKFDNSTDVYTNRFKYGSTLDLRSIERDDYDLTGWTKNDTDSLPVTTETIDIYEDTALVANWQATSYHTVTINPNGGLYGGSANTVTIENLRYGKPFTLGEASNGDKILDYYEVVSGTVDTAENGRLTAGSFIVVDDVELTAHWTKIVARIERTGKLYGSIMSAHNEAIENDIITLLVDTEETVTNEKTVTLDLNQHTVTGSLTNTENGNITLINGEINNPSGVAVTNNGTLTLGVDDYKDDGTANILNDNIRLIGTTAGLSQTNDTYKFYYYDGYLEGDLGLIGGYDGSPSYRNTFDGVVVHFYPFVNHIEQGSHRYQHVELESSDRAVSKTSVHGDIYYYNLQDNINTSVETGYKIYAVRNFDASYALTSPANTNVEIDIKGYTVNLNDTLTLYGTLSFEDSTSSVYETQVTNDETTTFPLVTEGSSSYITTTPHATSSTVASYTGKLTTPRTIINSTTGNLILKNIHLASSNNNPSITNNGTLTMEASVISNPNMVMETTSNGKYNMDHNSYLVGSGECTVNNKLTNFVWDTDGIIYSNRNALCNNGSSNSAASTTDTSSVEIKGGLIYGEMSGIYNNGWKTTAKISGGTVKSKRTGVDGVGILRMNSGTVIATGSENFTVMGAKSGDVIMNGGRIIAKMTSGATGNAIGIKYYNDNFISTRQIVLNGGEITAQSNTGKSFGIQAGELESGGSFDKMGTLTINGGSISASGGGTGYGVFIYHDVDSYIRGGSIYGENYGFHGYSRSNNISSGGGFSISSPKAVIIGTNDEEVKTDTPTIIGGSYAIYDGSYEFYDGVLRSNNKTIANNATIKVIPDGTVTHTESNSNYRANTWLINDEDNYLSVNGTDYSSLTAAYNAAQNGDTITVIANKTINASLPENPSDKTITLDLNGHELTYSQPIINKGTMTIIDSSSAQTGKIINTIKNTATINNTGTLNIESGYFDSDYRTVENMQGGTFNLSGGTIHSATTGIYNISPRNIKSTLNITGGQIIIDQPDRNVSVYGIEGGSYSETIIDVDGTQPFITVNAHNSTAYGISGNNTTLNSGNIQVTNTNGAAYGMYLYDAAAVINSGNITVTASGISYGINSSNTNSRPLDISNINIDSTSTGATGYGIFSMYSSRENGPRITGGTVKGSTYGIFAQRSYSSSEGTNLFEIGENDGQIETDEIEIIGGEAALANGPLAFYDGILRGGEKAAQDSTIAAIPEGTLIKIEASADYAENAWLTIDTVTYFQVGDAEFNSLNNAYAATTTENNVVKVIADATVDAVLPESPTDKDIIFDLNGHEITFSQSLITNNNFTIRDSSDSKTGKLINDSTTSTTILNHGNLTIESGYVQGTNNAAISVDRGSTLTVNGGTVYGKNGTAIEAYENYESGTIPEIYINGGLVSADATENSIRTIEGDYFLKINVTITGGQVRAENLSQDNYETVALYYIANLTIQGSNDETVIYAKNPNSGARGTSECTTINFKSGKVITEGHELLGLRATTITMEGGSITAHADTTSGYYTTSAGLSGTNVTIYDGFIDISAGNNVTGVSSITTLNYYGGTINARSIDGNSTGINIYNSNNSSTYNITGGNITASTDNPSESAQSKGIDIYSKNKTIKIANATIYGDTYGIFARSTTLALGNNDGSLNNEKPLIVGGQYAISGGTTQFYDGVLKGGINALTDTSLSIASNSSLHITTEHNDVNNIDYEVYQLQTSHNVVQIGSTKYTSLAAAISAATNNDTIEYIDDNYITSQVTIPSGKTITIDTNGYNTYILNQITNRGNTTITDSSADKTSVFNSNISGYFLTNNSGATLTIVDTSITLPRIIDNKGTLVLNGATLNATESAITNTGSIQAVDTNITNNATGTVTSNGSITTSARYAINSNAGTSTFDRVTIDGLINNTAGKLTFTNSTISKTKLQVAKYLITNAGTVELNATQATLNIEGGQGETAVINNTGTVNILNHSSITSGNESATSYAYLYGIYGASGTVNITDSTITVENQGARSYYSVGFYNNQGTLNFNSGSILVDNHYDGSAGIYNNSGNINITSGDIRAYGNRSNDGTIGIRNNSGTVTIGTPEPTTSPNYGGENADVSTTDPYIASTFYGTVSNIVKTYGITNTSGRVYFYDGKIVGGRAAMDKVPTGVEYLYEPKDEVDENGYYVRTLEWMRTQP